MQGLRFVAPVVAAVGIGLFQSGARAIEATAAVSARPSGAAFPLQLSANRRYLVDQQHRPYLVVGDSPQALIGNVSVADASAYIDNRKAAGFNAILVDLLCAKYTGCREDGTTFDGIKPFLKPGDLSTPNPKYFARADAIIERAAKAGIAVFLDPIETGGWLGALRSNGVAKASAYGSFVGRRYRRFSNIVWSNGNDFQSWTNANDDALVLAVAKAIHSAAPAQLQTVELNYLKSSSLDDPRWQSLIGLNAAYTYFPTYAEILRDYDRTPRLPVFMVEAGYEFEQVNSKVSPGNAAVIRRQAYWSILSGATGQFYGNHYTWQFTDGWKEHLDTPGSRAMTRLGGFLGKLDWSHLVPDEHHRFVTAGFGTFTTDGNVGSSNYVTAAVTPDSKLGLAYLPDGGAVTVDLRRFPRPVRIRWFDPRSGRLSTARPELAGTYQVRLSPPLTNAPDGARDLLLVVSSVTAR